MSEIMPQASDPPQSPSSRGPFPSWRITIAKIVDGGELPNWPDAPGVYVFWCASPGESEHRLGAILYVGVSGLLRRRISYALGVEGRGAPHGAQRPLLEFQKRGGVARVFTCPIRPDVNEEDLERALLLEYQDRIGSLPAWNKAGPGKTPVSDPARGLAASILDTMNVRASHP